MWAPGADLRSFRFLVGLVFQYPEYQLFEETCARDIAYGPRNMGLDEAEIARRVEEAAAFTGLDRALLERQPVRTFGRAEAPRRHRRRHGDGTAHPGAG